MSDDRYRDKDWLHDKYIVEGWSTTDIGKFCEVSHKTICRWLEKHGVPSRDSQACQLTLSKRHKRESTRSAIRDYLKKHGSPTQQAEMNKPSLKWE